MNQKNKIGNFLLALTIALIVMFALITPSNFIAKSSPGLTITTMTNSQRYYLRQRVNISGNVSIDGSPANNIVVVTQVKTPLDTTLAYRTLQIGNPTQDWPMNITSIYLGDANNNPIDQVKAGSQIQVSVNVYNPQLVSRAIYGTMTIFDANMVPIGATAWMDTIQPHQPGQGRSQFEIAKSATTGPALIVGNIYSDEPVKGGIAYCLEKPYYFWISRLQSGLMGYPQPSPPPPQTTPGVYNTSIRLPPDPRPGNYSIRVTGQQSPGVVSLATSTFNVQSTTGIPPQASFIYYPSNPYINMTVNFDASSSTPEGYNDWITKYEWDFGDGTPHVIKTGNPPDPTTTHMYRLNNTYLVTLNVTNNEPLWCITSKPIIVALDFGPKANFTWTPTNPYNNIDIVTFNASSSTPGWSAKSQSYPPIQNYTWNFGESSFNETKTTPTIDHIYSNPGNYTAMLTIVDAEGRSDTTTRLIQVLNSTQSVKTYDVNHDGVIDVKDIFKVAKAYGSYGPDFLYPGSPAHPNWNPDCDFNHDNQVDIKDYFPVCRHYGEDP